MHEGLDYLNAEINALALLRDGDTFKLALPTGEPAEKELSGKKAAKVFRRTIIKSRLRTIARELGLAPRLALGMAQVESGFDHGAVSPRGAIGVMQVMPQLAGERFEVEPEMLFDPEVNIRVGLLHMKYLLDRFNDNLDLSLAAYNAGARRVVLAGYRVPHISETREYVKKVKQAMNDYVAPTTWEE
jgi:soluble lytic murein transglycosylase-like protein